MTLKTPSAAGVIDKVADFETVPMVAVTVPILLTNVGIVPTENVTDDCPEGTVTDAGTVISELLVLSEVTNPDGPVGPLNVTRPCELLPATTVAGLRVTETSDAGETVRKADWDPLAFPTVIVTTL
jgi:hypothetical protein